MSRSALFFIFLLAAALLSAAVLATPRPARAEPIVNNAIVSMAPLGGSAKVELVALTVDLDVVEAGDHTSLSGQLAFKVHNLDRFTGTEQLVGFPTWGGGGTALNEKSFSQFVVSQNGETIEPQWQTANLKLGSETRSVRWLTFMLKLGPDERSTVQVALKQDLGDGVLPTITFAEAPAILWKGYVGSARYAIHMPVLTTPDQFRFVSPGDSSFDGKTLSWLYSEFNPAAPTVVQLVRPRTWRDIQQARAELAQGSAKAAFSLGGLYTQLAHATLSLSDFSLAAAAYQRGAELDPGSPNGALELARLYEARLRGEYGKVDDENALRATAMAQWQRALQLGAPGNEARDAVAQEALLLAQLARRAGQYDGALALLDSARAAASAKVPTAQLDSETRGNRAGLTLQQMDAGRWVEALQTIQAESLGSEAKTELSMYQPRLSGIQAATRFEGGRQSLAARLTPFPAASPELEKSLNDWLAKVRGAAGGDGKLTVDSGVYNLSLSVPVQALRAADVPAGGETVFLRELLLPADVKLSHSETAFSTDDGFSARYALSESQLSTQAKMDAIDRALQTLAAPAADENVELVRRLRVRALQQYRAGWQDLLGGSSAQITWHSPAPGLNTDEQWDVRPGDDQTLETHRMSYRWWTIAGVSAAGLLLLAGIALLAVLVIKRGHKATAPNT